MKNKPLSFDPSRKWFEIRNATATSADVFIYDEIGYFGITAGDVIKQLNELKVGTLNVHINSPGGSVFDGFAIYNALHSHPAKVLVQIDGIAASIASVIAMAGDEISMAENAMVMIHRPSCMAMGYANELRAQADVLDKLHENIAQVYVARTGMALDAVNAAMENETWYSSGECKALGFCSAVIASKKMAASFDLSAFKNAPKPLPTDAHTVRSEDNKTPPLSVYLLRQSLLESQQ